MFSPLDRPHSHITRISCLSGFSVSFFFNAPATTEIYTLSLHDALPIWDAILAHVGVAHVHMEPQDRVVHGDRRSEEHTSELQSLRHLVCRLLLEKKKKIITKHQYSKYSNIHNNTERTDSYKEINTYTIQ